MDLCNLENINTTTRSFLNTKVLKAGLPIRTYDVIGLCTSLSDSEYFQSGVCIQESPSTGLKQTPS